MQYAAFYNIKGGILQNGLFLKKGWFSSVMIVDYTIYQYLMFMVFSVFPFLHFVESLRCKNH